jgi:hypothetical protein
MKKGAGVIVMCLVLFSAALSLAEGGGVARIGESGEFLELSRQVDGRMVKDRLPLYRAEGGRYFSAGVGLEERMAEYPPFALKVVFTAGGNPYLSSVAVTIQSVKGETVLAIPQDQVEGPWLFVDLTPGIYNVTATHRDREQGLKGVKVEGEKQKVIHLRWAEDRGITGNLPSE